MFNTYISFIEEELYPLKQQLTSHQLYSCLREIGDVRTFMEKHVYAVWDFMSLLKALQINLTCTQVPWKPVKNAKTARFINEIVLGEESDINEQGVAKSHFEMYLDAMKEINASTDRVLQFIAPLDNMKDIDQHLASSDLKEAEKEFMQFTFDTIKTNKTHIIASAFTFGREDLIPDVFMEIIRGAKRKNGKSFPKLSYYLERHIELDGDDHGPLSLEMISELCGEDQNMWGEVLNTAKQALQKRIDLWNEIVSEITLKERLCVSSPT